MGIVALWSKGTNAFAQLIKVILDTESNDEERQLEYRVIRVFTPCFDPKILHGTRYV